MNNSVPEINSRAWDLEVDNQHWATVPISFEALPKLEREGYPISLTGSRQLPKNWLGNIKNKDILCLACGGGQQTLLLALRGANVVSLENSEKQLKTDFETANKHQVKIETILGSMDSKQAYPNRKFDYVLLGMGAQFVEDLSKVFPLVRDSLKNDGTFIGAFVNPICYLFDWAAYEEGKMEIKYRVPYSDLSSISKSERMRTIGKDSPVEFGHSLEQIFRGITQSGMTINDYIEEFDCKEKMGDYFPSYFSIIATKK